MKPKIMIDVTRSPKTGIGLYSWNLLDYLSTYDKDYSFIGLTFPNNVKYAISKRLKTIVISHNPTNEFEVKTVSNLIDSNCDLYIGTNFSQIVKPKVPVLQVIHDLIYMLNPQWQPTEKDMLLRHGSELLNYVNNNYKPYLREVLADYRNRENWEKLIGKTTISELYALTETYSIFRSKAIISVSFTTKEKILENYIIDKPIEVVYPIIYKLSNGNKVRFDEKIKNLIYIANFEPRKNHDFLLDSISKLPKNILENITLILVGKKLFQSHYYHFLEKYNYYKNHISIKLMEEISEEEKNALLSSNSILVYPSLDEGFGIPVLEGIIHNMPIIAFNIPIMREVCGNSALLVSKSSEKEFNEAICAIINNRDIRMKLHHEQKAQVGKFSNQEIKVKINSLISYCLENI